MRKALHITKWVLALLLLLLAGGLVAVQSPRVQTALGQKVLNSLQKKFDAQLSAEVLSLQLFDALTLENVTVLDPAPRQAGTDTLAHIRSLSARFSLAGLLRGDAAYLSHARIDGVVFNLVMETDSLARSGASANYQRIFRLPYPDPDRPDKPWGKILRARDIKLSDVRFRYVSQKGLQRDSLRGRSCDPGVANWNDLQIHLHHLHLRNLSVADEIISGRIVSGEATECGSGLHLTALSARHVRVGKGRARIERPHLQEASGTDLYLKYLQLDGKLDTDYDDFENRVRLDGVFRKGSVLSMNTVRHFSNNLDQYHWMGSLEGRATGYVSDFRLSNFHVEDLLHSFGLTVSGSMIGVTEIETCLLDAKVKDLHWTFAGLEGFVKDWSPSLQAGMSQLAKGQRFSFSGCAKGPMNRLHLAGTAISGIGQASADMMLRNVLDPARPIILDGRLQTKDLHLGRIAGIQELGPVSLRSSLSASLGESTSLQLDTLSISRLSALGYDYRDISASGSYSDDAFNLYLMADDPNLQLILQAEHSGPQYRLEAALQRANLHAIKLDSRERSLISFQADADFTQEDELCGEVRIRDLILDSEAGRHNLGKVNLSARSGGKEEFLRLRSGFLDADFSGDGPVTEFINDLQALTLKRDMAALGTSWPKDWQGNAYQASLKLYDAQALLGFLAPGVYVEKGTSAGISVNPGGLLQVKAKSGRLAYLDKYVKDLDLEADNSRGALQAQATSSSVSLGGTKLQRNRLSFFADDNHLGLGYNFDNGEEEQTRAELYLSADLSRGEKGLEVCARALPSNIYYLGNGWGLSSGDIRYAGSELKVEALRARHDDELLLVEGGFSPSRADTLTVRLEKFKLDLLNSLTGGEPSLEGVATGKALVISPSKPSIGLLAAISCDSTYVSGHRLGRLRLGSSWDEQNHRFKYHLRNQLDGRASLNLTGWMNTNGKLHATAQLDRLELGYAAPFLTSLFSAFSGSLSGEIWADGSLDQLKLGSRGLHLDDGRMTVDFTQVPYRIAGDLSLTEDALSFDRVTMEDGEGGLGSISGKLLLGGLKDLGVDTHVAVERMKVLSLARGQNSTVFGHLTASGQVDVTGPLDKLLLSIDARTNGAGELHLPLGGASSERARELLSFKEPLVEVPLDPYELMMASAPKAERGSSDLAVKLHVEVTPEVIAYIDIGEENSLNARGNGIIELETHTRQGDFSLGGEYLIQGGSFHFSAMNLVSRDFMIQDGSSVRFNGDVWDTDLNVNGVYVTKASLANLIADETAVSRRTVNCGIHISDKLRNPQVNFSIDIPDLNPTIQASVDQALNSDDKVQKQFIYLLIAGAFLPSEESGITTGGQDMLFSNVSSIMSGQINSIFQRLDIPLDLGLNYQATQTGDNIFDVAVSTQLFNNRVLVNGTVGNKQQLSGTTTSEIAGDLDIEVKLNRSGSLRLKGFSHSADQYTSYLDNSQRNGVGVSYQREFNTFAQFFRDLFTSRKTRERRAQEEALQAARKVTLQIDSTGRAVR